MNRYLQERQKAIETIGAVYAFTYAAFVATAYSITGNSPLYWTDMSIGAQLTLVWFMMFAGLVHGAGIRVNGYWRWSPVLRAVGLCAHFVAIAIIAVNAPLVSTAFVNYSFLAGLLLFGLLNSLRDVRKAVRYGKPAT